MKDLLTIPEPHFDEGQQIHFYTLKDAMKLAPKNYEDWVYSNETIKVEEVRIVSSPRLNRILTKCAWWVPFVIWPPIIAYLLWPLDSQKILMTSIGSLFWFPIEYLFHRFLFHMPVFNRASQFLHLMLHGVHHLAPYDLDHLVSPPLELGVQALAVFGLLTLVGVPHPECWLAGLLIQYLRYDLIHYSLHAFDREKLKKVPLIGHYLVKCKRNHLLHHFHDSRSRYTISYLVPGAN
jgi:hypothetical protein